MADGSKAEHWRGVVAEQEASGLSAAAFCRERAIPAWKFHYWRKRLREEASGHGEFAMVEVAQGGVYPDRQNAVVVVTFPSGAVLRAGHESLAEIVRALSRC